LLANEEQRKGTTMGDKALPDLKTFIESVNKKNKKHNGKKIKFRFVNRKRR
jgi:hypothetical protein